MRLMNNVVFVLASEEWICLAVAEGLERWHGASGRMKQRMPGLCPFNERKLLVLNCFF